jgi:tetratricopeptide (TPR) repeat protein/tRNA A-37 threonylcarbamoyl transferase component Bud32
VTGTDYTTVRDLYERLAGLDPVERARLLDREEITAHVRESVLRLFAVADATEDPLSGRIAGAARAAIVTPLPKQIGPYRILSLLGEGGMGSVFLGERADGEFHRRVAIKVVRGFAGAAERERFRRERQVLATLDHPNIAALLDGGTLEDGSPYLVMDYVEGEALPDWLDREPRPLRQRMRLFAAICRAIHHAHQNLVIHRDLKPTNVLVRTDGTPVLLDFGIAKLFGSNTSQVHTFSRAMTPAFASPEQLKGEIVTTASDVFGLGLILYRIVAGCVPPRGEGAHAAQVELPPPSRVAAESDSAAIRADAPRLRGDLDRIARVAVRSEARARYPSAQTMAEDVYAWLDGHPVSASGSNWRYLAGKFVRRHPRGIAAGLLGLVLVTGLVARLGLERSRAIAAAEQAELERARAMQATEFVQEMLSSVDPEIARGMDRQLMRVVLDSAALRAATELAPHSSLRMTIEQTIANSYASIAEYSLATEHYRLAEEAAHAISLPAVEHARLLDAQANALAGLGKRSEALTTSRRSLDLLADRPAGDRDRLRIESHLASREAGLSRLDDAAVRLRRVLATQRKALGPDDEDTLETQRELGVTLSRLDDHDEAIALLADARARHHRSHPDADRTSLELGLGLSAAYLDNEDYAAAEALLATCVPQADRLFGPNHPRTLVAVGYLAAALRNLGRLDEAHAYYERAYRTNRELFGDAHHLTIGAESNLARVLRDMGRYEAAEQHARDAVANARKTFGDRDPATAVFLDSLGSILVRRGRFDDAERQLLEAFAILDQHPAFGPGHARTREVISCLVDLYTAWKRPAMADRWRARGRIAVARQNPEMAHNPAAAPARHTR